MKGITISKFNYEYPINLQDFNMVKDSSNCKSKYSKKIPDRKIYTSSTLVRGAKFVKINLMVK